MVGNIFILTKLVVLADLSISAQNVKQKILDGVLMKGKTTTKIGNFVSSFWSAIVIIRSTNNPSR